MKKLITLVVVSLILATSVLAMNLWMSWTIFDDIEVEQGFHDYYTITHDSGAVFEKFVRWGTRDNEVYTLEVTAEGEGGKFFKKYKREIEITNGTFYQYDTYLNVPPSTDAMNYPYELCGKICNEQVTLCLAICQTGDVVVSEKIKSRGR